MEGEEGKLFNLEEGSRRKTQCTQLTLVFHFFLPSYAPKNHLGKPLFNKDKKHQLEKPDEVIILHLYQMFLFVCY